MRSKLTVFKHIIVATFLTGALPTFANSQGPCGPFLRSGAVKADRVLTRYRNSVRIMSQKMLNQIIDLKLAQNPEIHLGQYQTSTVRVALQIPSELRSVSEFPPGLVKLLNMADKAADRKFPYSDEYMSTKRGDYIVFQIDAHGEPDFYIPPKMASVRFEHRSVSELDQNQFQRIQQAIQREDPSLRLPFVGILNPEVIDVYSASALGIKREDTFNLHASWGVSEKPAGQSAVFARRHGANDGEVWKIKIDDGTGQPMNYRRIQVTTFSPQTYEAFVSWLAQQGEPLDQILKRSIERQPLGHGLNATVFEIVGTSDFLLRMATGDLNGYRQDSDFGQLKQVPDWARGHNLGQAIAEVGTIEIIKRQSGKPMGAMRFKAANDLKALREGRARLHEAARLPQEAYDQLARDYKFSILLGGRWDSGRADNLMIDFKKKKFGLIDVEAPRNSQGSLIELEELRAHAESLPPAERTELLEQLVLFEKEIESGSHIRIDFAEILISLFDNPNAERFGRTPDVIADRRAIIEKVARAAFNSRLGFGTRVSSSVAYSAHLAGIEQPLQEFQRSVVSP